MTQFIAKVDQYFDLGRLDYSISHLNAIPADFFQIVLFDCFKHAVNIKWNSISFQTYAQTFGVEGVFTTEKRMHMYKKIVDFNSIKVGEMSNQEAVFSVLRK